MKTTMKKVLSMALALVLVLGMLPMAAQATTVHTWVQDSSAGHHCTDTGCEQNTSTPIPHFDNNGNGICDICDYPMSASHTCTGGTATCSAKAICVACGGEYGDLAPHARTEVRDARAATCSATGHSGNTYCLDCGECIATGSVIPATGNHVDANSAWEYNDDEHYHTCGCGAIFDKANHIWEAATASTGEFCTVCRKGGSGPLGSATVRVAVLTGGTSQNGGSFTITASGTKTANEILSAYLSSSVSTHTASQISSSYVAAEGSATQYSGNQILEIAPNATYVLYLTPVNSTNNTQSNTNGIYVSFVPNYNTYTYATYVAGPLDSGVKLYTDIRHNITRTGYTLEGWYYDAALTQRVPNDAVITSSATFYAKWTQIAPYNVSVVIYTNGNKQTPTVTLDLYEWAQDGVITLADLQQAVVKHGIKANNNAGLSVYGPFTPNQWTSYVSHDYFRNSTERVSVNAGEATVLYAMVHNVKITKGTVDPYGTIADKSNPKTGDMIYAPMMVLGLSASALAVLFYLNKKRAF